MYSTIFRRQFIYNITRFCNVTSFSDYPQYMPAAAHIHCTQTRDEELGKLLAR